MADIKTGFGSANQAFTCTLASLANGTAQQTTEIDNSANLFMDALVFLKVKSGASGTSTAGYVAIYAFGSVDSGTTRTENAGATNAAITLTSPPNARLVGVVNVVVNATTYYGGPFSVASAFGGVLPQYWGLIISNQSGGTLDSAEGNHAKLWQGVYATQN